MRFSDIAGQERAVATIQAAVRNGRLPHAWIFHGRRGVGKTTAALALARLLQCAAPRDGAPCESCPSCHRSLHFNHPDIFLIPPTPATPDTQTGDQQRTEFIAGAQEDFRREAIFRLDESRPLEHRIRTMRWIRQEAARAPVNGPWKVFILKRAGLMNVESANAILKLLEEPNPGTLLILGMERPTDLPDTIRSRCALVRFHDLGMDTLVRLLTSRLKPPPEAVASGAPGADGASDSAVPAGWLATIRLAARVARGSLTRAAALVEEDVLALRDEALAMATRPAGDADVHRRLDEWMRSRDKTRAGLLFDLLLLLCEDLLRLSARAPDDREGLANADRAAELETWAARLSPADIRESARLVEEAKEALDGYGYFPLVLYSLLEQMPRGLAAGA